MGRVKEMLWEDTQDVFDVLVDTRNIPHDWDTYDALERAEYEMIIAFNHWKELKDKSE